MLVVEAKSTTNCEYPIMELIHMNRDKLAALPAALPMKANDTDLAEIAAIEYPSAVYVNRSTWHVLTEHSRRAMLATTLEEIPVLLVEIQEEKEIAAAVVYSRTSSFFADDDPPF